MCLLPPPRSDSPLGLLKHRLSRLRWDHMHRSYVWNGRRCCQCHNRGQKTSEGAQSDAGIFQAIEVLDPVSAWLGEEKSADIGCTVEEEAKPAHPSEKLDKAGAASLQSHEWPGMHHVPRDMKEKWFAWRPVCQPSRVFLMDPPGCDGHCADQNGNWNERQEAKSPRFAFQRASIKRKWSEYIPKDTSDGGKPSSPCAGQGLLL